MGDVIAILGFGEAGSLLALDLVAAGVVIRGFDPKVPAPAGVTQAASDAFDNLDALVLPGMVSDTRQHAVRRGHD